MMNQSPYPRAPIPQRPAGAPNPGRQQPSGNRNRTVKKTKSDVYLARLIVFLLFFVILLLIGGVLLLFTVLSGTGGKRAEEAPLPDEAVAADFPETALIEADYPETKRDYGYFTDLSAYEAYIAPADPDEYLILINATHPLDENDTPDDLVDIVDTRKDGRAAQKMRACAEKALEAMFIELRAAGYDDVSVTSGYRSYAQQSANFASYMQNYSSLSESEAYARTATVIAVPGTSEHQSGLCCDMHNLASADESFANQDAAKWLAENCWKYGFILRYPDGKTDITGITFEPWHFRFVGRYHAEKIMTAGLTLEEYWTQLGRE